MNSVTGDVQTDSVELLERKFPVIYQCEGCMVSN